MTLLKGMGMEPKLKGKEFESLVAERLEKLKEQGRAHFNKYGVQVVGSPDRSHPSGIRWDPIRSFPDFEGVMTNGRQVIFDTKVCSQASFDLSKYRWEGTKSGPRARQLRHMLDRSMYRVPCYFLMHWNAREGKTFSEPSETYLFPVSNDIDFWLRFLRAEVKSINRKDCETYGTAVLWDKIGMERTYRPDLLRAIEKDVAERNL